MVLDVWPEVHAWGVLCLPKDIKPGERRPVVVCQHGLEGVPRDTIEKDVPGFRYYKAFAAELAEPGFITFAPYNLYRGDDRFRSLPAQGQPAGASLFSIIIPAARADPQLAGKPRRYVDRSRIGFYGLSYGGKSAMRVPALRRGLLPVDLLGRLQRLGPQERERRVSRQLHVHRRIGDLRVGPGPHVQLRRDGLPDLPAAVHGRARAPRRRGDRPLGGLRVRQDPLALRQPGPGDKTEIEFFNGPHAIHGVGTYEFLHRHLDWPKR